MASAEVELDAHGFEVPTQFVSKYNAVRQSTQGLPAATVSWPALLEQAALKGYRAGGPLPPRFVAAVREGVPDEHRAAAWLLLSGAAAKRDEQPGLYATLLAAARSHSEDHEVEEQIDRDLHRTFPGHPALTPAFCQRIKNVLLAYSARNPEVAYCQGMNFVCAAILMFIEQEDAAFWMLSHVVEEVLVDHYVQSMLGHQVDQQVLEQLLEQQLPHVGGHLRTLSLSVPFITTQWFLCLFLNALPSETCFRVWDLIFCLHRCTLFQVSVALFGAMEDHSLLDTSDIGPAVFVVRSATRSCFDASALFAIAQSRFPEVTVRRVEAMRERWRQTTLEVLHAKTRWRELQDLQQHVQDTFGHQQARSLLLALRLDGACAHRRVRQAELADTLKGYLPEKECAVVLQFVLASGGEARPDELAADASSLHESGGNGGSGEAGGGLLLGAQVAVSIAVLCDGPVEERMRLCFEAFDAGAKGSLAPEELVAMLHAVYRTYYRQPPPHEETAAFAECVFLLPTPLAKPPSKKALLKYYEQRPQHTHPLQPVPLERYLHLATGQPTLVLCFSKRKRLLRTPRITRRAHKDPLSARPASDDGGPVTFEKVLSGALPMCVTRRPKGAERPPPLQLAPDCAPTAAPTAASSAFASAAASSTDGLEEKVRSGVAAVSELLGGALDGALSAMQVPLRRNPLGANLLEPSDGAAAEDKLEELRLAMAEAGLEPGRLRVAIGFDCGESNVRAGKNVFRGNFLHASAAEGMLGPDPNPYQMALFMLGKAFEAVGYAGEARCFCFNTALQSPRASAAAAAEPAACGGMEAALEYYNSLPPSLFRGAKGASGASGLAQAVELSTEIAEGAASDGALLTLCVLLTPGQGFDPALSRAALDRAHARGCGLSVLCVGLGDGPFHGLGRLAASHPLLFNALDLHAVLHDAKFPDRRLAVEAFRVTPEQVEHASARRAAKGQSTAG